MEMLRRMFGAPRARIPQRPEFVASEGPDARMVYRESQNPMDIAAAANFSALYGRANLPPAMGMRGVIEVRGPEGNWTPVAGDSTFDPGMQAQAAALQSYRETGIIGAQPINPDGTLSIPESNIAEPGQLGGVIETGTPSSGGGSSSTDPRLTDQESRINAQTVAPGTDPRLENQEARINDQTVAPAEQPAVFPDEAKLLQQLMAGEGTPNPNTQRLTDMLLKDLDRRLQMRLGDSGPPTKENARAQTPQAQTQAPAAPAPAPAQSQLPSIGTGMQRDRGAPQPSQAPTRPSTGTYDPNRFPQPGARDANGAPIAVPRSNNVVRMF